MTSSSDELTPVERPLLRSDIDDVRRAVRDVAQNQVSFYSEWQEIRGEVKTIRYSRAVCLLAAAVSVLGACARFL